MKPLNHLFEPLQSSLNIYQTSNRCCAQYGEIDKADQFRANQRRLEASLKPRVRNPVTVDECSSV